MVQLTMPDFPVKPWKAPRPTRKPFDPKPGEPGAEATWRELLPVDMTNLRCESCNRTHGYWNDIPGNGRAECRLCWHQQPRCEWVTRSGQVWSKAELTSSFFVVPYRRREDEHCVLLRQGKNDREPRHVCTYSRSDWRVRTHIRLRPAA